MSDFKIKFSADTKSALAGIDNINNSVKSIQSSINVLNAAIAGIAISKLAGFATDIIKGGVDAAASYEMLSVQLEVLTGSADKAKNLLEDITKFAKDTPFQLTDITTSTKLLLNFGIETDNVMGIIKSLGSASDGSGDKLQRMARAFGQMSALGKATREDINQMIEAGFNPLNEIVRTTGITMSELLAQVTAGTISPTMISDAFKSASEEGGRFYNILQRQSETYEGKVSNLIDGIESLKRKFGEPIINSLKPILDDLNNSLPQLSSIATTMGEAIKNVFDKLKGTLPTIIEDFAKNVKSGSLGDAIGKLITDSLKSEGIKSALTELGKIIGEGFRIAIQDVIPSVWKETSTTGKVAIGGAAAVGGASILNGAINLVKNITGLGKGIVSTVRAIPGQQPISVMAQYQTPLQVTRGLLTSPISKVPISGTLLLSLATAIGGFAAGNQIYTSNEGFLRNWQDKFFGGLESVPPDPSRLNYIEEKNQQEKIKAEQRSVEQHKKYIDELVNTIDSEIINLKNNEIKRIADIANAKETQGIVDSVRGAMLGGLDATGSNLADILLNPEAQGMTRTPLPIQNAKIEGYSPFQTSRSALGLGQFYSGKDTLASMQKITNDYLAKIAKNTDRMKLTPSWS